MSSWYIEGESGGITKTKMIHYFAYGSNLHPGRLIKRISSAKLIGVSELFRYRLIFHKKSKDESGKCNLIQTGSRSDLVYGAIYEITPDQKSDLDRIEGKGFGYLDEKISLQLQGSEYGCFVYFAQPPYIFESLKPYHWYKHLVVIGARYLRFPDFYVRSIEAVESIQDPDESRRKANEKLIKEILNYQG